MRTAKPVSKDEFDLFVKNYPAKLETDVAQMCEPPFLSYNDFSGGKVWPESIVAYIVLNERMKGHSAYKGEPNEYYIYE